MAKVEAAFIYTEKRVQELAAVVQGLAAVVLKELKAGRLDLGADLAGTRRCVRSLAGANLPATECGWCGSDVAHGFTKCDDSDESASRAPKFVDRVRGR